MPESQSKESKRSSIRGFFGYRGKGKGKKGSNRPETPLPPQVPQCLWINADTSIAIDPSGVESVAYSLIPTLETMPVYFADTGKPYSERGTIFVQPNIDSKGRHLYRGYSIPPYSSDPSLSCQWAPSLKYEAEWHRKDRETEGSNIATRDKYEAQQEWHDAVMKIGLLEIRLAGNCCADRVCVVDAESLKLLQKGSQANATIRVSSNGQPKPGRPLRTNQNLFQSSSPRDHLDPSAFVLITSTAEGGIRTALAKPGKPDDLFKFSAEHRSAFKRTNGTSLVDQTVEACSQLWTEFVKTEDDPAMKSNQVARGLTDYFFCDEESVDWARIKSQDPTKYTEALLRWTEVGLEDRLRRLGSAEDGYNAPKVRSVKPDEFEQVLESGDFDTSHKEISRKSNRADILGEFKRIDDGLDVHPAKGIWTYDSKRSSV